MRKVVAVGLIAVALLSLAAGCAMSPEKRQELLMRQALQMRAAAGGTGQCWNAPAIGVPKANAQPIPCPPGIPAGSVVNVDNSDITVYSEAEESPPAAPLMSQYGSELPPFSEGDQGEDILTVPAAAPQLPPPPTPTPSPTPGPTPVPTPTLAPPSPAPSRTPIAPVVARQAPKAARTPPTQAAEIHPEEKIIFRGVFFDRNSADLTLVDELILDLSVDVLKRHPKLRIYVKGYSESRGNPDRNQFLSQERAANVAAYFQSQGVSLNQLIVVGMGSTHPIADNTTAQGRAKNRRVELEPVPEQP